QKIKIDPQLFSGIFGALNMLSNKAMDAIIMNDSKLLIVPGKPEDKFHVIGRAARKTRDKKIHNILDRIHQGFKDEWGIEIENWIGNADEFDSFKAQIEKSYFS
ncbi:MAG: hypothetical protein ACTSYU_02985, partial [Promethearchaeota archaeon]